MSAAHLSLNAVARALGGEVSGKSSVVCPGPGHTGKDRSLCVTLSAAAPDGFIVFSHAGEDWRACRDYVAGRLGVVARPSKVERAAVAHPRPHRVADGDRSAKALEVWHGSVDPRGTVAERYLASRCLALGEDVAGQVLRWNNRIGAMVALFRNIQTDRPQAISRTFLDAGGRKLRRRFLGPVGGCAIKLDQANVLGRLHICEGIETCMTARQLGLRPCWALGSAGAVARFPVLAGVERLTLLAENDKASARAVESCARRWHDAGQNVIINEPIGGKDLNDAIRRAA
ncbi:toprim domain-containing protein [Roseiarcus sp.]|uniref:toprim domain-containing protein n=1 Tax=Roseiarcus sp. TaxID=1969460 RepID=UPI003F9B1925